MKVSELSTLCICALRYSMGRKTYMPKTVIEICEKYIAEFDDSTILTMLHDCVQQEEEQKYGDERIDKPLWVSWRRRLEEEAYGRKI